MSDNTIFCASLPEAFASVAMVYPDKHMEPGVAADRKVTHLKGFC